MANKIIKLDKKLNEYYTNLFIGEKVYLRDIFKIEKYRSNLVAPYGVRMIYIGHFFRDKPNCIFMQQNWYKTQNSRDKHIALLRFALYQLGIITREIMGDEYEIYRNKSEERRKSKT